MNLPPSSRGARRAGEPVAIIGLSALFPGAGDLTAYWAEILSGRDALTDIPAGHWSTADYYDPDPKAEDKVYGRRGGFLSPVPFEPLKYGIAPNDLPAIDSAQLLALVAADRALADAGYPASGEGADHRRTAVILGVTGALKMVVSLGSRLAHPQLRRALADSGVDEAASAEVLRRFANEFTPWVENSFPGLLGNVTAGRVAGRLNLGGTNLVVDAACASSLAAVRHALMELRGGQADLVVTGGVDAFNDPFMYACFSKTPALSPTGVVRPFDRDGDGTMLGEGVGLLVLKRLAEARRDGDRVYAVIREIGSASDGRGAAIFAPTAEGQERALNNAYETSGVDPGTVELVEGHGTGTNVGDAVEVEALTRVFGQSPRAGAGRPWCALGAVKAQIGHTKAAAGAAGLIKAALALYRKTLPPAVNVSRPLADLEREDSPFHLSTRPRPWVKSGKKPRRAAVSAFGFGGTNFHCLMEEDGPDKPGPETPPFELFTFSADSPAGLKSRLERAAAAGLAAAPASRLDWQPSAPVRLIFTATPADWPELIRRAGEILNRPDPETAAWPAGFFFGRGQAALEAYGLLAPRSTGARTGMFRELALAWPEMLKSLGSAQSALATGASELGPLGQTLYPPDLASAEFRRALTADWADPRSRRAAVHAVTRGFGDILANFGPPPAAVLNSDEIEGGLAAGLNRPENRPLGLWVALEPLDQAVLEALPAETAARISPLADDGWAGLAGLLGRLAALGYPLDFAAWPAASAPAVAEAKPDFTVLISGANQFVKKEIPPSSRSAAQPAAANERLADRPRRSALETLTAETARLHQVFLNQQAEALDLLRRELEGSGPARVSSAPAAASAVPASAVPASAVPPRLEPPKPEPAEELVLAVLARETGYPRDMLHLDLSLESDLGLDSIKKVEIMATLGEERPDLAALPASALSEAVTLRDLAALFRATPSPAGEPAALSPGRAAGRDLWAELQAVVAQETGYPLEMLTPRMRVSEDLGLDSIKIVEVLSLMGERLGRTEPVSAEAALNAPTLGDLAEVLAQATPAA
ncbi:MAG: phosphopantetheine-binding protein, partial [Candidatus Adiutrix sp.]|nr:phosphopantetheine-binding protein [Candidatus Adiutrix sp.]